MRALPGNMNRNSPGAHRGNKWVYWAPHPTDIIDQEMYFQPIHNHVGRTDEIEAYADLPDGSWFQATFRVLHSEPKCVIVKRTTDWVLFSLEVEGVDLVDRGNDRFDVIETGTGRTLKRDADRTTAHALAHAYRARGLDRLEGEDVEIVAEKRGPGRPRKEAA